MKGEQRAASAFVSGLLELVKIKGLTETMSVKIFLKLPTTFARLQVRIPLPYTLYQKTEKLTHSGVNFLSFLDICIIHRIFAIYV